MALKLKADINKALEKALAGKLGYEPKVVAALDAAQVVSDQVTVNIMVPYSIMQTLVTGNDVPNYIVPLVNLAMWTRLFACDIGYLDQDHVDSDDDALYSIWVSADSDELRAIYEHMIENILDEVLGTDAEVFVAKTLDDAGYSSMLSLTASTDWSKSGYAYLNAMNALIGKVTGVVPTFGDKKTGEASVSVPVESAIKELAAGSKVAFQSVQDGNPIANLNLPPVKLVDATALFQPVQSSSEGSLYHTVALFDGMNMAARIKPDGAISIRFEGKKLASYKDTLEKMGVTSYAKYASIHMNAGSDKGLQLKTLGAFIMAVDAPLLTPLAQVSQIIGKGK